jgi:N-methylhydantoinase A
MGLRVAIDIGGGFVDLVALDEESGSTYWSKAKVTPRNLGECVKDVFQLSKVEPGLVTQLLHGQTLVINAILERRGAKVGLITTKGFRDVLAIQRSNRRDIFNLRYRKPEPFVTRERRIEVDERTLADGRVLREVNAAQVREACQALFDDGGVESVAICFINSYRNPSNEIRAQELIQEFQETTGDGRAIYVCSSSEVSREWREYERSSTCVLNAYVMPIVNRYLEQLTQDFHGMGMKGTFYMMLSGGGVASIDYAARRPIETVEGGPAAGVIGAAKLGELTGNHNIIALDGGSTTTKASLLEGLHTKFTTAYAVERDERQPGYPITVPVVDINEIGNGGGSIAWLDEVGQLRVGPLSAGAHPGPACYGWGGTAPTLTDAYLLIGFLNPENFLGGTFRIHPKLAEAAVAGIAQHFEIPVEEAAGAIVRVGNNNAAQLLRLITIQRGFDPRDFTLVAYGGSGPLMAPYLAEELEIPKVVIPAIPPGNFSAWGLLMSDLRHTLGQTLVHRLGSADSVQVLQTACGLLESEVREIYRQEGIKEGVLVERAGDLRYYGQEHTITVPLAEGPITPDSIAQWSARFADSHQREYGFVLPSVIELVNLRVSGVVQVSKPSPRPRQSHTQNVEDARSGERFVYWVGEEKVRTPIYWRDLLPRAAQLDGPAVIEEPSTTIVVPRSFRAVLDELGNIILRRR